MKKIFPEEKKRNTARMPARLPDNAKTILLTMAIFAGVLFANGCSTCGYTYDELNTLKKSSPQELASYSKSDCVVKRAAAAQSSNTPPDILAALAKDPGIYQCTKGGIKRVLLEWGSDCLGQACKDVRVYGNIKIPPGCFPADGGAGNEKIREDVAANPSTPAEALKQLAFDDDAGIRKAIASNPSTPAEIKQFVMGDAGDVSEAAADNPSPPAETPQKLVQGSDKGASDAATLTTKGNVVAQNVAVARKDHAAALVSVPHAVAVARTPHNVAVARKNRGAALASAPHAVAVARTPHNVAVARKDSAATLVPAAYAVAAPLTDRAEMQKCMMNYELLENIEGLGYSANRAEMQKCMLDYELLELLIK